MKKVNIKQNKQKVTDLNVQKVGLKAFFNIMDLWKIKQADALILLGSPGRSTYFKWKKGEVSNIPYDIMKRVSYILGIYKALQIIFSNPDQADSWLTKPNDYFGGHSALHRMLAGDITDLACVREYLDSIRSGGM